VRTGLGAALQTHQKTVDTAAQHSIAPVAFTLFGDGQTARKFGGAAWTDNASAKAAGQPRVYLCDDGNQTNRHMTRSPG
jgi:hypothetical protein